MMEIEGNDLGELQFRNGSVRVVHDGRGYWWADTEYHGHGEFPDWEGPFETYRQMIEDAESMFGHCLENADG